MSVDFLSRWKFQLKSNDRKMQIVALVELVHLLNNVDEENYEKIFEALINSDICHFLSELITFHHPSIIVLVNKIVCHLSEIKDFFKNDFNRMIKGYLKLINSFPNASINLEQKQNRYIVDSFKTASLLIKRAIRRDVNFQKEKIPLIGLLTTISMIHENYFKNVHILQFVNVLVQVLSTMPIKKEDLQYRQQKLMIVVQSLNCDSKSICNPTYLQLSTNLIQTVIAMASSKEQAKNEVIVRVIMEKFMAIVKFIVCENESLQNFEIFCQTFYYLFESPNISQSQKRMMLNYFFSLNGLDCIVKMANNSTQNEDYRIAFKSKIILTEIMQNFVTIFLALDQNNVANLKEKFVKIAFMCDYQRLSRREINIIQQDVSQETLMLMILLEYVHFQWKLSARGNGEILNGMALILAHIKQNRMEVDKGILAMLISLFTTSYANVSIAESQILQTSSALVLKTATKIKVCVDLKFMEWWFIQHHEKDAEYCNKITEFVSTSNEITQNLTNDNLFLFDQELMLKMLEAETTSVRGLANLTSIMCKSSLNTYDIEHLFELYNKCHDMDNRFKSNCILEILCANVKNLKINKKSDYEISIVSNGFEKSSRDLRERMLLIQLASLLIDLLYPKLS